MRRILGLIAALGFAAAASAQPVSAQITVVGPAAASTQTVNHATANQPSAAGDGANIAGLSSCTVVVSAASGQTLSGAGTVRLWYYNSTIARWAENMDVYSTQGVSSQRDSLTQAFNVGVKTGRLYAEARSVTASGGALTVRLVCWK